MSGQDERRLAEEARQGGHERIPIIQELADALDASEGRVRQLEEALANLSGAATCLYTCTSIGNPDDVEACRDNFRKTAQLVRTVLASRPGPDSEKAECAFARCSEPSPCPTHEMNPDAAARARADSEENLCGEKFPPDCEDGTCLECRRCYRDYVAWKADGNDRLRGPSSG